MRKQLETYSEFMNEAKQTTEYLLDDNTWARRINYKGHDYWINPKKGDKTVTIHAPSQWDPNKGDFEHPQKDEKGKVIKLKISDLYGDSVKVFPG